MNPTEGSYDHPIHVLTEIVEHLLAGEDRRHGFVHQVDAEWGHIYLQPPHRDDPYTFASVRATLTVLLDRLRAAESK